MICHVITDFSARAGAQTMLARLLSVSREKRILVISLTTVSERNRRLANNPRVEFVSLGSRHLTALPRMLARLGRILKTERPQVVVCWMYHAMVAGTLAGKLAGTQLPIFWNVRQSLDDPASLSRNTRMALAASRFLSHTPNGIIYNSSRALHLHRIYGYRNANAIVIPNGFEIPPHSDPVAKVPITLGIAGRFHPQKDHATYFRAAALAAQSHPHCRFVAAGEGLTHQNADVARLIAQAGLPPHQIELRGEVDDMSTFYRDIDAFVLSSRTEGFPNVIAEAMSYGKPVITTNVGDSAVVVGDTGLSCQCRIRRPWLARCGLSLIFRARSTLTLAAPQRNGSAQSSC